MKRVIQRKIDHYDYLPVAPAFLQVGTTIDFDCYIKRFNGYVIIIHAGTEITESLYSRIQTHARIYIANAQRELYQKYRTAHVKQESGPQKVDEDVPAVDELSLALKKTRTSEAQISLLYRSGVTLMQKSFDAPDESFSVGKVSAYAKILADFVSSGRHRLTAFLDNMPGTYSEPNHAVNVAILSIILAKALKLDPKELEAIALAGLLHDIGKSKVDPEILAKESELSDDEFATVREHVLLSVQMLKNDKAMSAQIISAIRYHHERLDGSGYPNRLVGNQIPVMAQIIALSDIFDAMTTDRTYRTRYSSFEALRVIKREMQKQINGLHVDHLIKLLGS